MFAACFTEKHPRDPGQMQTFNHVLAVLFMAFIFRGWSDSLLYTSLFMQGHRVTELFVSVSLSLSLSFALESF